MIQARECHGLDKGEANANKEVYEQIQDMFWINDGEDLLMDWICRMQQRK